MSDKKVASERVMSCAGRFLVCLVVVCTLCVVSSAGADEGADVEQRLQRMERLLANQNLVKMLTTLQSLQQEVSTLRGDIDLLNHELKQIKKQQKDIYIDLDQRIQGVVEQVSVIQVAPMAPAGSFSGESGGGFDVSQDENLSPEATQDAFSKEQDYQNALNLLKIGKHQEAIEAFQVYLVSYPSSDLAANAQYWMAEAYYVLKDYESAVVHFNKVIDTYPSSRKVADAHLKMGYSYYELKKWQDAKLMLDKVIADHPGSTASRLASRRLDRMKIEGYLTRD